MSVIYATLYTSSENSWKKYFHLGTRLDFTRAYARMHGSHISALFILDFIILGGVYHFVLCGRAWSPILKKMISKLVAQIIPRWSTDSPWMYRKVPLLVFKVSFLERTPLGFGFPIWNSMTEIFWNFVIFLKWPTLNSG